MRIIIAAAVLLLILSGCRHDDSEAVPTFDADQSWSGDASPVLTWSEVQRNAFLDQYADTITNALTAAGLATASPADTTAVNALERAKAIGPVVPRPVNELMLLDTAQQRTGQTPSSSEEATMLDAAWSACKRLKDGATYADLVYAAAKAYQTKPAADPDRNNLAATLYSPIVCPDYAGDALSAIAGIDGLDALG